MASSAVGPLVVPAATESNGNVTHLLLPRSAWITVEPSAERGLHVQHRVERVVVDLDGLGGVLRRGGVAGHDDGDDLAGEADRVDGDRDVARRGVASPLIGHAQGSPACSASRSAPV